MILYRKPFLVPATHSSFTNYTHLYSFTGNSDSGSYITVVKTNFIQLNIFNNITAIAAYGGIIPLRTLSQANQFDRITYPTFLHKGIVLNLEDFPGSVEIAESQFTRNMHFIPEGASMPRKPSDQTGIE